MDGVRGKDLSNKALYLTGGANKLSKVRAKDQSPRTNRIMYKNKGKLFICDVKSRLCCIYYFVMFQCPAQEIILAGQLRLSQVGGAVTLP